jgi:hypothetical protein
MPGELNNFRQGLLKIIEHTSDCCWQHGFKNKKPDLYAVRIRYQWLCLLAAL